MNEAVCGGESHSVVLEDLPPVARPLIGGDEEGPLMSSKSTLVSAGDVIENHQMIFVELGDRSWRVFGGRPGDVEQGPWSA
jgi:hypothetical protein